MANPDGTPIWFELTTPDQDAAQPFYEAVAGWSVMTSPNPVHGGYRLALAGEEAIAGLMARQGEMPTGWTIYFAANDIDGLAARVKELGGQVHVGPMDIPDVGRFAAVADPQGVMFNLMKGSSPENSTAFKQQPDGSGVGHGVWVELATPEPDGAFDFYGKLFGWTKAGAMPMGDMGEYAFIGADGPPCAGGSQQATGPGAIMSSAKTGAPARWNWYVEVPDIDAALATAKDKGGSVIQGPDEIPGGSYSANVADAQGFQIGLVGPRK